MHPSKNLVPHSGMREVVREAAGKAAVRAEVGWVAAARAVVRVAVVREAVARAVVARAGA